MKIPRTCRATGRCHAILAASRTLRRVSALMDDKFDTMTRDELLVELRGLLFRYEQFRNTTLPTLNDVSKERDALNREVARLEARLDQVGADLDSIAQMRVEAIGDPRAVLAEVRRLAVTVYQRALLRDYFTDEPLDDDPSSAATS